MSKFRIILEQLKAHAPFTSLGAFLGVAFCLLFKDLSHDASHRLFEIFHPFHVFLSALATSAMYRKFASHQKKTASYFLSLLMIGFVGSIGVATLSDSVIPFLGEYLLRLKHMHLHVGFIESWYIVLPSALLGIIIAYVKPQFKSSHTTHIVVSTWASLFHIMMALDGNLSFVVGIGIFVFLFLAVWLPCCLSDIVFPLLFTGKVEVCSHEKHRK